MEGSAGGTDERRRGPLTQTLWIPGPLPSLNELIAAAKGFGGNGYGYSKLKREWSETIWALAKSARLRPVTRASLRFEWHEKNRRRDPDNVSSAGRKLALDGLVKAGVLPGDGWDAIAGLADSFVVDPGRSGVLVTLESDGP